jgi:hypothetical protein
MLFGGEYFSNTWLDVVAKCRASSGNAMEPQSLSPWLLSLYGVNYGDSV